MTDKFLTRKYKYELEIKKDGNTEHRSEMDFEDEEDAKEAMDKCIAVCTSQGYEIVKTEISCYYIIE